MSQLPLVTVLMPAYNSSAYISDAVASILNQTYQSFELLIYDDHSTDDTVALVETFQDSRIFIVEKEQHSGYTKSLKAGIVAAKGKYIARMDSDDISHPRRLEKQVDFLESNTGYGVVGCNVQTISDNGEGQVWSYPPEDESIRLYTIINSPFAHPSVMIRKEVLQKHALDYNEAYEPCEDYKLWVDLLKFTRGANIGEVLLYYRLHPQQTINTQKQKLIARSNTVRSEVMESLFNVRLTPEELHRHYYFFNEIGKNDSAMLQDKYAWKRKLNALFDHSDLKDSGNKLIEKYWLINLRTLTDYKPRFIKYLFNSSLLKKGSFLEAGKFVFKCLSNYKVSGG